MNEKQNNELHKIHDFCAKVIDKSIRLHFFHNGLFIIYNVTHTDKELPWAIFCFEYDITIPI